MAFLEEIKKKVPEPDEILLEGGVWGPGAEEVMMENKGQAKDLALATACPLSWDGSGGWSPCQHQRGVGDQVRSPLTVLPRARVGQHRRGEPDP